MADVLTLLADKPWRSRNAILRSIYLRVADFRDRGAVGRPGDRPLLVMRDLCSADEPFGQGRFGGRQFQAGCE